MDLDPAGLSPGDEVAFLFKELGDLSDSFLSKHLALVPEYVDTLVGKLPRDTADVDTWWWLTAIGIALAPLIQEFKQNLQQRYDSYYDYGLEAEVPYSPTQKLVEGNMTSAAAGIDIKTRQSIMNGLRGEDLGNGIRDAVEKEIKEFIEALDTAFSIHDRVAIRELGEEGKDRFQDYWIYAGPADKRNRAFCGDIVRRNSVFTSRGIDKLNAHPDLHTYVPPNVSVMCGGHGCRHIWLPIQPGSPLFVGRTIED